MGIGSWLVIGKGHMLGAAVVQHGGWVTAREIGKWTVLL